MALTTETTLWFNNNLVNDGASVMSGKNAGVQACVKSEAPLAFYICFNAHCLSLVLVDSVKCIPEADWGFFLSFFQKLYVFVSGTKSGKRYKGKNFKVHLESYKG